MRQKKPPRQKKLQAVPTRVPQHPMPIMLAALRFVNESAAHSHGKFAQETPNIKKRGSASEANGPPEGRLAGME